jgi:uncharacterized membrane protein YhhN
MESFFVVGFLLFLLGKCYFLCLINEGVGTFPSLGDGD